MQVVKDCVLTKEGLTVPSDVLASVGLDKGSIEVMTKKHTIIIRKSMTDQVRGIIKNARLTTKELDELWHQRDGVDATA